ncbi:hypothetical protein [Solibacillus sp. FSL W7-1324]|uniref:hypothetical protein n=2 Tax=Solibacillus TaxID=648800 RepID=UPI0030FB60CB
MWTNYLLYGSFIVMIVTLVFLFIAKKRMDRNEPAFGWKRRQFLAEQAMGGPTNTNTAAPTKDEANLAKIQAKDDLDHESIMDLLEIKNIEKSVITREKNEYIAILSTDFVNFHLLQPSERQAILEGYQQLYSMVSFPFQMLGQAVPQDFSKERLRFEKNLSKVNPHAAEYNRDVLNHIQHVTENDFRITLRFYYIVKYAYEPSKMAKLTPEQREQIIYQNVWSRAEIIRSALRRAKVNAQLLSTIETAEVFKRALNRDRMLIHPMNDVLDKEKLSHFVSMDVTTLPDFESLVTNPEAFKELYYEYNEQFNVEAAEKHDELTFDYEQFNQMNEVLAVEESMEQQSVQSQPFLQPTQPVQPKQSVQSPPPVEPQQNVHNQQIEPEQEMSMDVWSDK